MNPYLIFPCLVVVLLESEVYLFSHRWCVALVAGLLYSACATVNYMVVLRIKEGHWRFL